MLAATNVINIQSVKRASKRVIQKNTAKENLYWTECVVKIARKQDKAAFQELFNHYAPKLKTFFINNNFDDVQAEELMQETFIKVWRYADYFEQNKGQVSTWIYTIARNIKLDTYRKNGRQINTVELEHQTVETGDEHQFSDKMGEQLRDFILQLPPEQVEVIQKVYFEDLSHQKAADVLNLTLGTVKGRLRSAVNSLAQLVGGN